MHLSLSYLLTFPFQPWELLETLCIGDFEHSSFMNVSCGCEAHQWGPAMVWKHKCPSSFYDMDMRTVTLLHLIVWSSRNSGTALLWKAFITCLFPTLNIGQLPTIHRCAHFHGVTVTSMISAVTVHILFLLFTFTFLQLIDSLTVMTCFSISSFSMNVTFSTLWLYGICWHREARSPFYSVSLWFSQIPFFPQLSSIFH